ncbi:hypothetical protein AA313_de0207681 [Arthrobotrys entomopaga]|nr:hypothetical protein AA313_de0207681 [Arthrobotrys entomopaga]
MPALLPSVVPGQHESDGLKNWGVPNESTEDLSKKDKPSDNQALELGVSNLTLEERPSESPEEVDLYKYFVDLNKKFSAIFKFELAKSICESINENLKYLPVFTEETDKVLNSFKRKMADPCNKYSSDKGNICETLARATSGRIRPYISQIKRDMDSLSEVISKCWDLERILLADLRRKRHKLLRLRLPESQRTVKTLIFDSLEDEFMNSRNRRMILNTTYDCELFDIWMDTQRMNRLLEAIEAAQKEYGWWERERDLANYPEQADELRIIMEAQKAREKANAAKANQSWLGDEKFEQMEELTRYIRNSALNDKAYAKWQEVVHILDTGSD